MRQVRIPPIGVVAVAVVLAALGSACARSGATSAERLDGPVPVARPEAQQVPAGEEGSPDSPVGQVDGGSADAFSEDPTEAFRVLDEARRALLADPDPEKAPRIWEPGTEVFAAAVADLEAFAANGHRVEETGFAVRSAEVVARASEVDVSLRVVLEPGAGRVVGDANRRWEAREPVAYDVGLRRGDDGRWRIFYDEEVGPVVVDE